MKPKFIYAGDNKRDQDMHESTCDDPECEGIPLTETWINVDYILKMGIAKEGYILELVNGKFMQFEKDKTPTQLKQLFQELEKDMELVEKYTFDDNEEI